MVDICPMAGVLVDVEKRSLRRRVGTATALPALAQLTAQLTGALVLVFAARRLDATSLSTYLIAGAVAAVVAPLADGGLLISGVREAARSGDEARVVRTVLMWRIVTGALAGAIVVAAVTLLVHGSTASAFACGLMVGASVLMGSVVGAYRVPPQLHLAVGRVARADLAGRLTGQAVLVSVILLSGPRRPPGRSAWRSSPVRPWPASRSSGPTYAGFRYVPASPDRAGSRRMLAVAVPLAEPCFNQLCFRVDTFVIASTRSATELAAYGLSTRLIEAALVGAGFFQMAMLPTLTQAGDDTTRWRMTLRRSAYLLAGLGFGALVVLLPVSRRVLEIAGNGRYAFATATLQILLVAGAIAAVNGLLGMALIALGRQWEALWLNLTCLLLNVLGCLALVPLSGIAAAAWVTLATEILTVVGNLFMLRRWAPRPTEVGP